MSFRISIKKELVLIFIAIVFGVIAYLVEELLIRRGLLQKSYEIWIIALIVLIFGVAVIRILNKMLVKFSTPFIGPHRVNALSLVFTTIAYLILLTVFLGSFGINVVAAFVTAGFLAIVIGLAAQTVLGNIIAGFSIIFSQPFRIGDSITFASWQYGNVWPTYPHEKFVNGFDGTVFEISLIYTTLLLNDGTYAKIPNGIMVQAMVINHSTPGNRTNEIRVEVDRKMDVDELKGKILSKLDENDLIVNNSGTVNIIDLTLTSYTLMISFKSNKKLDNNLRNSVLNEVLKLTQK